VAINRGLSVIRTVITWRHVPQPSQLIKILFGSFLSPSNDYSGYFSERGIQAMIPHPLFELGVNLTMAGVETTPVLVNVEGELVGVVLMENEILEQVCGSVELIQEDVSVLNIG
jgi:hypothetical protein